MIEPSKLKTVLLAVKKEAKPHLSDKSYQIFCSQLGRLNSLVLNFNEACRQGYFRDAKKLVSKMQSFYDTSLSNLFKTNKAKALISECQSIINQYGHYDHKRNVFSEKVGATINGVPAYCFSTSADDWDDCMTEFSMVDAKYPVPPIRI